MDSPETDFLDYSSWKWRSLQLRRTFLFPIICLFLSIIWFILVNMFYDNCSEQSTECSTPWKFLVLGTGYFFFTFHLGFAIFTLCSRWGMSLLHQPSMGWRLCMMTVLSWFCALLVLSIHAVEEWDLGEFERAQWATALSILCPIFSHHLGFTLREIRPTALALIAPWVMFKQHIQGLSFPFVLMTGLQFLFGLWTVVIQEAEYSRYFDLLCNPNKHRSSRTGGRLTDPAEGNFRDVITVLNRMRQRIGKLEFDIRQRIKKALMSERQPHSQKQSSGKAVNLGARISNPLDAASTLLTHHPGIMYEIDTLSGAIAVALMNDASLFEGDTNFGQVGTPMQQTHGPGEDSSSKFTLSEVCERLGQVFEDSLFPHVAPLFFDRAAGDVTFYGKSRQAIETVLFLIIFDAVCGNHPGFCSVSYEQKDDAAESLRLVITEVLSAAGTQRRDIVAPDKRRADKNDIIGQLLPENLISDESVPQSWLAQRLFQMYFKLPVVTLGPERKNGMLTMRWVLDLTTLNYRCDRHIIVDMCDVEGRSYSWIVFDTSVDLQSDGGGSLEDRNYSKFLSTLDVLHVSHSQCPLEDYQADRDYVGQSKIGVIREGILLKLSDSEIEFLLHMASDIIILAEGEAKNHDPAIFFSKFPVTFSRKEWSSDFRRAIGIRVPIDISAQEFVTKFRNFKRSDRHSEVTTRVVARPEYASMDFDDVPAAVGSSKRSMQKPVASHVRAWTLAQRLYSSRVATEAPERVISFSEDWKQSFDEWLRGPGGFPLLLRVLAKEDSHSATKLSLEARLSQSDLDVHTILTPEQRRQFIFVENSFKLLQSNVCLSFHVLERLKAHSLEILGADMAYPTRTLFYYLMHCYIKPLTTFRTTLAAIAQVCKDSLWTGEGVRGLVSSLRVELRILIERAAFDDLDFLNIFFQITATVISEVFEEFLPQMARRVIPCMLDLAENSIWEIPAIADSCYANLYDE